MSEPTSLINKLTSNKVLLGITAFATVVTLGLAPAASTSALAGTDKSDVGINVSNKSDDGDESWAGLRLLSMDDLKNLGVQSNAGTKSSSGDETATASKLELTDTLQNVSAGVTGMHKSDDGSMQNAGLGLTSLDNLDKTTTNLGLNNKSDTGDEQSLGLGLVTDQLDKITGNVMGQSKTNGDTTGLNLPFTFE